MAATLLNFATAAQEIPAQAGKIIQIRRLLQTTTGSIFGTPYITVKNDESEDIAPPFPISTDPLDLVFPDECPQGNRGEAVSISASDSSANTYVWVAWQYVD